MAESMNQSLADELITMMNDDQRLLQQLFETGELPSDAYHPVIKALHEHIFKQNIRNKHSQES
jgi:hypothetical protein